MKTRCVVGALSELPIKLDLQMSDQAHEIANRAQNSSWSVEKATRALQRLNVAAFEHFNFAMTHVAKSRR